ncbi:SDR family oxidoreductase [Agrobacterium tumefaciens]|uniref:SDR family oxidoreductase n=1 Tax=Agrobacterium tumefaciens TaxID=358 RepID=UPI0021D0FF84|nr:SDR family oxidoreductase [Agrobacterium tumefaciens]NTZ63469.1 SDR family oxidoreductase [Agrobacterium tumefaciens]UXT00196.1 SDR family oxidoreductase [Agrobacterium tumefaciens]UXT52896.1 SDR family oxidoreductase [Agrobacterium tumefaciens]
MTDVVVFGANGRTGRIIVKKLLDRGHNVTAAMRNPAAFSDFRDGARHPQRLRTASVDIEDPASVLASVDGQTAAIAASGTGRKPDGLYSRGTRNIVTPWRRRAHPGFSASRQAAQTGTIRTSASGSAGSSSRWPEVRKRFPLLRGISTSNSCVAHLAH